MIDCNNCSHISITEEQQERLWRTTGKKAMLSHMCTKYNQRVLHYPYREPMIHPCQQCEEEKENEKITNQRIEELRNKIIDCYNYEPDLEYKKRLEEYHKKIEDDFQAEWPKQKFKWFFKKRRQRKLRAQITRRYSGPVFWIIEDVLGDLLSSQYQDSEFFGKFVDVKDIAEGYKTTDSQIEELNRALTYLNTLPAPVKKIKVKSEFYDHLLKMTPPISSSEVDGVYGVFTGIPVVIDDEIEDDYEPVY